MPFGAYRLASYTLGGGGSQAPSTAISYLLESNTPGSQSSPWLSAPDGLGNFYLAWTSTAASSFIRAVVMKIASDGTITWQKAYGSSSIASTLGGLKVLPNGNVAIVGRWSSTSIFHVIIDPSNGNITYQNTAQVSAGSNPSAWGVGYTSGSDSYGVGYESNQTVIVINKITSGGTGSARQFISNNNSSLYALTRLAADSNIIAAYGYVTSGSTQATQILSYDGTNLTALGTYGANQGSSPQAICVDTSSNVYIIDTGRNIVKVNSSGVIQWQKVLNVGGFQARQISTDGTNVFVLAFYNGAAYLMAFNCSTGAITWQNKLTRTGKDFDAENRSIMHSGLQVYATIYNITDDTVVALNVPKDGTGTGTYGSYSYATSTDFSVSNQTFTASTTVSYNGSTTNVFNNLVSTATPAFTMTKY